MNENSDLCPVANSLRKYHVHLAIFQSSNFVKSLRAGIFAVKISIARTISHNEGFEEYTRINTVLGKLQGICRRLSIPNPFRIFNMADHIDFKYTKLVKK